jgi:hypothetical protein
MNELCCCKMCLDHVTSQVEFLAAQKVYDEMVQKRYRMRILGYHWGRYTCGWASDEVERRAAEVVMNVEQPMGKKSRKFLGFRI